MQTNIYSEYNKPFYDENNLIIFLQDKNLLINNQNKAKKVLKNISYYRFKIYSYPYYNSDKIFIENTKFEDIEALYRMDEELRVLLFKIISRIEIKLRSKLNYQITKFTSDTFWYLDKKYFMNEYNHQTMLINLNNTFIKGKDLFINHYKDKYVNFKNKHYKHMPPFWIMSEIMTFGELLNLFKSLKKSEFINGNVNELDNLAKEFGAFNIQEFNRWLDYIKTIRNKCAHHARIWNEYYRNVTNMLRPDRLTIQSVDNYRIYNFLAILNIILKKLEININLKSEIEYLFFKYKQFDDLKEKAGFPANWREDIFWTSDDYQNWLYNNLT